MEAVAAQRIRHHVFATERDSFTYALWQAEGAGKAPELQPLLGDILTCLQTINCELNTERPSEAIDGKADVLARTLAADMSAILSEGWDYYLRWTSKGLFAATNRSELAAMLIRIGIAWDAVLAGDIDDIHEHVQTEYLARQYGA